MKITGDVYRKLIIHRLRSLYQRHACVAKDCCTEAGLCCADVQCRPNVTREGLRILSYFYNSRVEENKYE